MWGNVVQVILAPFVCRHTAAAVWWRWYGGKLKLMQCSPLPNSAPILLFFFFSPLIWLLGDHIPGTKRAQLVWTGLSDPTSCSGWERFTINARLLRLKKRKCVSYLPVYIPSAYAWIILIYLMVFSSLVPFSIWVLIKCLRMHLLAFLKWLLIMHGVPRFLQCCVDSADCQPSFLCQSWAQNHCHFPLKCRCFSAQSAQ